MQAYQRTASLPVLCTAVAKKGGARVTNELCVQILGRALLPLEPHFDGLLARLKVEWLYVAVLTEQSRFPQSFFTCARRCSQIARRFS